MKVAFIGSGAWATALANVVSNNGHEAMIYGICLPEIQDINQNHKNSTYFNDVLISQNIVATTDLRDCVKDASIIVLAVPSNQIYKVACQVDEFIVNQPIIVNVAKGFDPTTHERLSVTISKQLGHKVKGVCSLIGPSHAEEVILGLYTAICAVCSDNEVAKFVQAVFSNQYFRIYVNNDEIGSEYGAAAKNVIALAVGIITGLGYGDNTKAALMTRGLAEIARFGVFMGAKANTYLGLTGLGDLIVTCQSVHSRNYQAGLAIGKMNSAKEFISQNKKTVEGILACQILYQEAIKYNIEMPIVNSIYNVLFNETSPNEELMNLMNRTLKSE